MNKAMFIDLDGTLLTSDHKITNQNKEAISKAQEAGWDIVISTGKSYANAKRYYDELKLDTWLITSQGQLIKKPNSKKAITNFMDHNDIKEILSKGNPESFAIETIDKVYINKVKDERIAKFLNTKTEKYSNQEINGIIGLYIIIDKLHYYEHKNFDIYKWDTGHKYKVLSFKPKGINKTYALKAVVAQEGYKTMVVFGNGRNDLKSLKMANLGIAMNNSQKKVLQEVPIKSEKSNEESGVGIEIMKILSGKYKV